MFAIITREKKESGCLTTAVQGLDNPYLQALSQAAAIADIQLSGVISRVSDRFIEDFSVNQSEIAGSLLLSQLFQAGEYELDSHDLWLALQRGEPRTGRARLAIGNKAPVRFTIIPVELDGKEGHDAYVAIIQDISLEIDADEARKKLTETAIRHSILSGTVHNIGNLATTLKGRSDFAIGQSESVLVATRSLMDFVAQKQNENPSIATRNTIDLVMADGLKLIENELVAIKSSIQLVSGVSAQVGGVVEATRKHFSQKLEMNDLLNAMEAIQETLLPIAKEVPNVLIEIKGCEKITLRTNRQFFQQILVNLTGNALDAISEKWAGRSGGRLVISLSRHENMACIV